MHLRKHNTTKEWQRLYGDRVHRDDEKDHWIATAVAMVLENKAIPVDVLANLDMHGVSINWIFKEAASMSPDPDQTNCYVIGED